MKMPSATEWALLQALPAREISGRDLAKLYEKETGKSMSYGTLYTTMRRLKESGWVEAREEEDGDGRIRLFKLSNKGAQALPQMRALLETFAQGNHPLGCKGETERRESP